MNADKQKRKLAKVFLAAHGCMSWHQAQRLIRKADKIQARLDSAQFRSRPSVTTSGRP